LVAEQSDIAVLQIPETTKLELFLIWAGFASYLIVGNTSGQEGCSGGTSKGNNFECVYQIRN